MKNKLIFLSFQILEGIEMSVNETSTGFPTDSRVAEARLMMPMTDFQVKDCKGFQWGLALEFK